MNRRCFKNTRSGFIDNTAHAFELLCKAIFTEIILIELRGDFSTTGTLTNSSLVFTLSVFLRGYHSIRPIDDLF